MDALSSQKEKADQRIEKLQQEVEALDKEIAAKNKEETNEQEEKQSLLSEVQQLREAVETLKNKDHEIVRLQAELHLLKDEKLKLGNQLDLAKEELKQLKAVNEQLQTVASPLGESESTKDSVSELGSPTDGVVGTPLHDHDVKVESGVVSPLQEAIPIPQQSISLQMEPTTTQSSMKDARFEELNESRMELSEAQAELTKVKALNEKLKAKIRVLMKKERVKAESVPEYDANEIQSDIEKARQDKLNLEKTAHELRKELVEIVGQKDGIIGDLRTRIQQLLDEKSRNEVLLEKYEKFVAERDEEIKKIATNADLEAQNLKQSYQHLVEEMDILEKKFQVERLEYVEELENTKDGYEKVLNKKEEEVEIVRREVRNGKIEVEQLRQRLQEAHQSLDELNKLKANFDHIVSGLRDDLQQALDEKAAADQLAHEFQVQLTKTESLTDQNAVASVEGMGKINLAAQLLPVQEEAAPVRDTLDNDTMENEDLKRRSEAIKQREKPDIRTTSERTDDRVDENVFPEEALKISDDVVWLRKELKETLDLNSKLKEALKKKRTGTRSRSSKEEEMSDETRDELERIRAAKIDSDKQMADLRLELDDFVQEKERIVAGLKFKMEKVLEEKERANSLIEEHEKQLLEKDNVLQDLTEKFELLNSDNEALKKDLESMAEVKSELQLTVHANTELENHLQGSQSLVMENTERISELERELENRIEKHLKEIKEIKQEHDEVLSVKQKEADETILELRQINSELQDNLQSISDRSDVMERELMQTKAKLEQVVQDSYPVTEEKERKIQKLLSEIEDRRMETDKTIAELERSESMLQEQVRVLEVSGTELKEQFEEIHTEMENQRLQFQRNREEKEIEMRDEREGHLQQIQELEAKFEELSSQSQKSISLLEEELASAKDEIESLKEKIQIADNEKQGIEKLRSDFDNIISGLREDLQQAISGKTAADELAHEFQVQLEKMRKSNPGLSKKVDTSPPLQENKISEMLEAAQREEADLRAALEATVKEKDAMQARIHDFELLLAAKNEKEAFSGDDGNLKDVNKDIVEKVVEEVILKSSEGNQVCAPPASETEVELENLKNELQRVKILNDKMKAKLRTAMKKRRVKSDSVDEGTIVRDELQTELENVRQEKLESEKTCQELRMELDTFVREKEKIVNELKTRIDELTSQNEKTSASVKELLAQISEKDGQLLALTNDVRAVESDNDQAWKNVEDLRDENANLCAEIDDLVVQRKESEKDFTELKVYYERLIEEYGFLLDKKDKSIADLEAQLEDLTGKYKTELRATRDQHEEIIFQIQNHANNLERECLWATKEIEQLRSQLSDLKNEREDVHKLKEDFNHIVSSLREDLQLALDGKAAADQIAHEFQVQLKQFEDVAVDTSDTIQRREVEVQEKLNAVKSEADNLRKTLESFREEKQQLENKVRSLESELQEMKTAKVNTGEEKEHFQSPEEIVLSESETLLGAAPPEIISLDNYEREDIQKVRDDLSKVQGELDKVKSVSERLKTKLKTLMRKTKEGKVEANEAESGKELHAELAKTRQEKLDIERAAQQLRVELDEIVREKERMVSELKTKIQQLLKEKEEINSLLENNEKLLLERDAAITSFAGQLQSLGDEHEHVKQALALANSENRNLKAFLEQLQLQKVKAERELQGATVELERLLEGDRPLLEEKDQRIANLEAELSNQKQLFAAEMGAVKNQYDVVVSEQQNYANNLEQTFTSVNVEKEQLNSRVNALEERLEDIDKLRTNFNHIVSGLREDLQSAREGKNAAEEIAYELQVKMKRLQKSSSLSESEVSDACIGTEDTNFHVSPDKDGEREELHTALRHLKEDKCELEEQIVALDDVLKDTEGNCKIFNLECCQRNVLLKSTNANMRNETLSVVLNWSFLSFLSLFDCVLKRCSWFGLIANGATGIRPSLLQVDRRTLLIL